MTYRAISKQIGVNSHTLRHWRETSKAKSVIKAVRIAEPNSKPKSEVVLVGPRGLRIEGLNLSELAQPLVRLRGSTEAELLAATRRRAGENKFDMRKSFNTLSVLVEQEMKRSVLTGDLFLFVNKTRKRRKGFVLRWHWGLCFGEATRQRIFCCDLLRSGVEKARADRR